MLVLGRQAGGEQGRELRQDSSVCKGGWGELGEGAQAR